jgi:Uma2 family endonuclease
MATPAVLTKKYSIAEFETLPDDGKLYELINGELVEKMAAGEEHGNISSLLNIYMGGYVLQNKLGRTYPSDTGFILDPQTDLVRIPDLAFVSAERVVKPKKFIPLAPDLAVEVVSPTDSFSDVEEKVELYKEKGVGLIWVIDPEKQRIYIYRSGSNQRDMLTIADELDGENVVQGFKLKVSALFE